MIEPSILKMLQAPHRRAGAVLGARARAGAPGGVADLRPGELLESVRGRDYEGLLDQNVMAKKQQEEDEFRSQGDGQSGVEGGLRRRVGRDRGGGEESGSRAKEQFFHGTRFAHWPTLPATIVQYVAEIKKPDGERLAGYHEAQLESLRFQLFSPAPDLPGDGDRAHHRRAGTGSGRSWRQTIRSSRSCCDGSTPKEAATALVNGTKLADPAVRKKLVEGGEAAVAASDDPMIVLARKLDPMRRELIKWTEDNVQSVRAAGRRAARQGALRGLRQDHLSRRHLHAAAFLRPGEGLSDERHQGALQDHVLRPVRPRHQLRFRRPVRSARRYKEGRDKLDLATPLNFVTTNDIIGGNSGSPVINRNAEIVGLIFDGNIESLVGDFVYEAKTNRAVAVHTAAMTEALRKLYGAQALINELMPEEAKRN